MHILFATHSLKIVNEKTLNSRKLYTKLTEIFGNLVGLIVTIFYGDTPTPNSDHLTTFYAEINEFIKAKSNIKVC